MARASRGGGTGPQVGDFSSHPASRAAISTWVSSAWPAPFNLSFGPARGPRRLRPRFPIQTEAQSLHGLDAGPLGAAGPPGLAQAALAGQALAR